MKDGLLLLLAAIVLSVLGWGFWHYLDEDAFTIFSMLVLITVAIDNARLRRKLKSPQGDGVGVKSPDR